MVPSIQDEISYIIDTLFCAQWQKFASWLEPNTYFGGNDLESIIMVKNTF